MSQSVRPASSSGGVATISTARPSRLAISRATSTSKPSTAPSRGVCGCPGVTAARSNPFWRICSRPSVIRTGPSRVSRPPATAVTTIAVRTRKAAASRSADRRPPIGTPRSRARSCGSARVSANVASSTRSGRSPGASSWNHRASRSSTAIRWFMPTVRRRGPREGGRRSPGSRARSRFRSGSATSRSRPARRAPRRSRVPADPRSSGGRAPPADRA